MRNLILVCVLFFCTHLQAQFRYVDQHKVAGPVVITFQDGTVQSGIAKYHNTGNFFSKMFSDFKDINMMHNSGLIVQNVKFKATGEKDFKEYDVNLVKKVNFINKSGNSFLELHNIKVASLNFDDFEIKTTFTVFLPLLMDGNFTTYGYSVYDRNAYLYTYAFVKVSGEDYMVSLTQNTFLPSETKVFKVLSYLGKDCPSYQDYMKEVDAAGNLVCRNEYELAFKAFTSTRKQIISEAKDTKQLSNAQAKISYRMRKDLYYVSFLNEKYAEFCK